MAATVIDLEAAAEHPLLAMPWVTRSACLGVDPDLFFPERGEDTRPAKAICARCPVRDECLEFAITNVEKHGVWGGMSERERRRLRRDRARQRRQLQVVS